MWAHMRKLQKFCRRVLPVLFRLVNKSIATKQNKTRRTQSISWTFIACFMTQKHSPPKSDREIWENKGTFAFPKVMSCCSPSRKVKQCRNRGPAKSSLCLANTMENNQIFLSVVTLFSPTCCSVSFWAEGMLQITCRHFTAGRVLGNYPFFSLSHNMNFIRLGYALFAKSKYHSVINAHYLEKDTVRHLNR